MSKEEYYKAIAEHYDREAESYEERLQNNKTLEKIRNDFRRVTDEFIRGNSVLDFGCGTGLDICHFAASYPAKTFFAIDLSEKMIKQARINSSQQNLKNVHLLAGSLDQLDDQAFDFIYSFFGASNTVYDLNVFAGQLQRHLNDRGRILITFVNKWYPMGMLAYLRRLKFKKAFERLKGIWWGYSENYVLRSQLHYGPQVLKVFKEFNLLYKRGYSITYPAWFQDRMAQKLGTFGEKLWVLDGFLSKTPFWSWGEYILLVFEKKDQ
jgi:ubiquinone/menaquinone biosynthesis C-methylase UbiE